MHIHLSFICLFIGMLFFNGCDHKDVGSVNAFNEVVQEQSPVLDQTEQVKTVKSIEDKKLEEANQFKTFYVYSDRATKSNHYVPSGFMPDGKCLTLDESWSKDCHLGESCIRVFYDVVCSRQEAKWAGIYWLNPANNWGQRKGGYNLTGAKKLTFWAKGEKGGEQILEFIVGGVSGSYSDSDMASIGPVILSDQWREYSIDLRGKDLSYISGGFAWTSSESINKDNCVFYLDEMRFE